jgi:hypothetical protein
MPTLMGNIPMKDYGDSNNIWPELVKILRSKIFDRDLQIKGPVSTTSPLANLPRFLAETRALFRRERKLFTQPPKTI